MILGMSVLMMSSSLFFSPQERAAIERLDDANVPKNPMEKEELPLVLNGILYRPDLNHWIVWINGVRIYSQRPQSIQGWTIVSVSMDSVVVRSSNGEERELRPDQDPDLDEFNANLDENEGYADNNFEDQAFDQSKNGWFEEKKSLPYSEDPGEIVSKNGDNGVEPHKNVSGNDGGTGELEEKNSHQNKMNSANIPQDKEIFEDSQGEGSSTSMPATSRKKGAMVATSQEDSGVVKGEDGEDSGEENSGEEGDGEEGDGEEGDGQEGDGQEGDGEESHEASGNVSHSPGSNGEIKSNNDPRDPHPPVPRKEKKDFEKEGAE